jgi:glycosyltransferase involved in cell wall biosynthesis
MTSFPLPKVAKKLESDEGKNTTPLVSIGLPTFNRAETLLTAIKSVLGQDYENLELLISDNASTDSTQSLCEEYSAIDKRVRYTRQTHNCGMVNNFRAVLSRAAGEYFMWVSDDDSLDPSYLSRCVAVLDSRPDISLVCGVPTYFDNDNGPSEGVKVDLQQASGIARVMSFYSQVIDNGTFYGLARRHLLAANPLPAVLGGDWLMIASLAYLGKIVTLEDIAVFRSKRGASADVRSLARLFGLSAKKARQPHKTIALNVAIDIARNSRAFQSLNVFARWTLAAKCAFLIRRRFVANERSSQTIARKVRHKVKQFLQLD